MIDPHAHLRDWNQADKETLEHGLKTAVKAGLDGVFEMPNTDPPITTYERALKRIKSVDALRLDIFHGIYMGLTTEEGQAAAAVRTYRLHFPRVVGFKLYAGSTTGNLALTIREQQEKVLRELVGLGYEGLLAVHCEKESLLRPDLWDPERPFTHTLARPPEAETESVKDIIGLAKKAEFSGVLHVCHVSVPESVEVIEKERQGAGFRITWGITPHHALMYDEMMKKKDGILLKTNPPLRPRAMQERMLELLRDERIDWIETDHAPHTLNEKTEKPFSSGIPVLPFYPDFIKILKTMGFDGGKIERLTHNNIVDAFNVRIRYDKKLPRYEIKGEYEFDPFEQVKREFEKISG